MTSKRCLIKKTFPLFHASPLPPLFDFSEPPLKHFPSLVALALMLGSGGSFAAPTPEIARLSLFLFDGEHSYEDRRVVQPVSQFPSHLGVHFESSLNNEGVQVFTWTIKNTGNTPIHNLRFTGLADVDISADTNTFFNEYGTLQSLSVPAGAMAPDKWEIGEPGYHHGDLIARAFTGNLNQRSDHEVATNADDAAMALSLPVEALDAGQTLTLTAWLGNIRQGLQQIDIADQGTIGFLMFATKDQIAPSIQTADYAVTKTALASSVNVGDKTGFQIAVTNLGADAGTGVTLTDIISPELSNLTWRCTVTGNAVCGTTAGTSHAINVTAQIPTGDSVIVRIDGTAGVAGTLINTATIAANEGTVDPNLANNQSTARIVVVDNPPPDPGTDPDTDTHIVNAYGLSHTTLITTGAAVKDGNVYVWGFRGSGQQGNGVLAVTDKTPPAKVKSLSNITHLTGGAYHLVALDQEGNVYGWGQSGYGETGCAPNTLIYVTTPCRVMGNVQAIAAGEYFTVALDKDGNVWTWGHNLYGQLGDGTINNSSAPKKVNLNGEKARLIGGAYEGAFAVTEEGHVWGWGDNEGSGLGFQGTNYGVQKIVRVPTRAMHLEAYADQMVYIAGGNGWGEALLKDGRVIGWGTRASLGVGVTSTASSSPTPVVIMDEVVQLFARYVGSFARTKDGNVYTWGQTGGSAFPMVYGHNTTLHWMREKPKAIGGGKEHLFYLTEEGKLYGIGYNDLYKLDQTKCCAPNIEWPGVEIKLE